MQALTPAERRGAMIVVLLLAIGAGYDLWRARSPRLAPVPAARFASEIPPGDPRTSRVDPESVIRASEARPAKRDSIVDLNAATAIELDALPGIGPVLAKRIVEHRALHGPFGSLEELLAVRGIGPRLLDRLRGRARAGPETAR